MMMWMIFPLGIPYTLWRMFGKTKICKECSGEILVDVDSMLGLRLLAASEEALLGKIASGGVSKPQTATHAMAKTRPDTFNQPTPAQNPSPAAILPEEALADPPKPARKPRAHQDPNQW